MSHSDDLETLRLDCLKAFGEAWDRGDVDTLMAAMADDCLYGASVGPEPGRTYSGKDQVRRGFEEMLAYDANGVSRSGEVFITGNRAVAEWAYVMTDEDGNQSVIKGIDIFTFDGDKICRKEAYRKMYCPEEIRGA